MVQPSQQLSMRLSCVKAESLYAGQTHG